MLDSPPTHNLAKTENKRTVKFTPKLHPCSLKKGTEKDKSTEPFDHRWTGSGPAGEVGGILDPDPFSSI